MSSIFGQMGPQTMEFDALECLKIDVSTFSWLPGVMPFMPSSIRFLTAVSFKVEGKII